MVNFKMYLFCALYRVLSIFLIQTWFVPDEYWQGPEVAHRMAFGYGHLTWEWVLGIRSYIYPLLIATVYKLLEFLSLDTAGMIVLAPRVMQALISAAGDFYFIKWCRNTNNVLSMWPVFMILSNWFWFYCATRTLSNTVETVLTIVGLYLYPWADAEMSWTVYGRVVKPSDVDRRPSYLWFVGLACIVRPSAFAVWTPLVAAHLYTSPYPINLIGKKFVPIGLVLLVVSTVIDSVCLNRLSVTWLNFFNANVVKDIGALYGTHSWYWYIPVGMPVVLGIQVVPLFWRFFLPYIPARYAHMDGLLIASIWSTLVMFSFLSHKEFRFLLPLVPMCLHLATSLLVVWSNFASKARMWAAAGALFVLSLAPILYTGLFHQRGVVDLMAVLVRDVAPAGPAGADLLFLMPCHSTPLYSHLHVNVTTRFLTCEPNFTGIQDYVDEADEFYENPAHWLAINYQLGRKLPSHVICFDVLHPKIDAFLHAREYILDLELWHSHFPSERVGSSVLVYKKRKVINVDRKTIEVVRVKDSLHFMEIAAKKKPGTAQIKAAKDTFVKSSADKKTPVVNKDEF